MSCSHIFTSEESLNMLSGERPGDTPVSVGLNEYSLSTYPRKGDSEWTWLQVYGLSSFNTSVCVCDQVNNRKLFSCPVLRYSRFPPASPALMLVRHTCSRQKTCANQSLVILEARRENLVFWRTDSLFWIYHIRQIESRKVQGNGKEVLGSLLILHVL